MSARLKPSAQKTNLVALDADTARELGELVGKKLGPLFASLLEPIRGTTANVGVLVEAVRDLQHRVKALEAREARP